MPPKAVAPPLAPVVADASSDAILNRSYNRSHGNPLIQAARASKRRRVAHQLHVADPLNVTEIEVGQQEAFAQQQVSAIGGVPPWAGAILAQLGHIDAQLGNIDARLGNIDARVRNAMVLGPQDVLTPVQLPGGGLPSGMPPVGLTLHALNGLSAVALSNMLLAYGVAVPATRSARLIQLKKFLGIRPM